MHVVVVGAGAFGGWIALHLLRTAGVRVTLVDAWGPGNARASSGGETRVIRAVYGVDRASIQLAVRSLQIWKAQEAEWKTRLFYRNGVLFLAERGDTFLETSAGILQEHGVTTELWTAKEAAARYPQINFDGIETVLFEADAGFLTARENCRTVLKHFVREGGTFLRGQVQTNPEVSGTLRRLGLCDGTAIEAGTTLEADQFVFACGPWMGEMFPARLKDVIRPTKQDVLFVGTPAGDDRFGVNALPCWADRASKNKFYGIPDFQHRGFKLAADMRGRAFDPNTEDRCLDDTSWLNAKEYLQHRFPALRQAPLLEARVCQYENTPDLGLLIDRHPEAENVWLVGGGSGHGYKLGPAVGEYAAALVSEKRDLDPAFTVARFEGNTIHRLSSF